MAEFESVEHNLVDFFRHFAVKRTSGEVREMPGVSIASAGVSFHLFNTAFLSEPVEHSISALERRIAIASVHFAARGLRWAFWVCEDRLDSGIRKRAQAVFHRSGLGLAARLPGMSAESLAPPVRPLPPLIVQRVDDKQRRIDFCHVLSIVFAVPFPWALEVYDQKDLWSGGLDGYVGYSEGAPAAIAATLTAAGVAGLYCVGTLPGHGGKGFAEKVVRHSLERVREERGVGRFILQSSADALPLYRRLGFEIVTHFCIYNSP